MLLLCTKDGQIVDWANNAGSGAGRWGEILRPSPLATQQDAARFFSSALNILGRSEPLCLCAHGDDAELKDPADGAAGWVWSVEMIASLLAAHAPRGYRGPVLFQICSSRAVSFAERLCESLESIQALNGVWVYGYGQPVGTQQVYPDPQALAGNVELRGRRVSIPFGRRALKAVSRASGYVIARLKARR